MRSYNIFMKFRREKNGDEFEGKYSDGSLVIGRDSVLIFGEVDKRYDTIDWRDNNSKQWKVESREVEASESNPEVIQAGFKVGDKWIQTFSPKEKGQEQD